jgi:hypothetical protein
VCVLFSYDANEAHRIEANSLLFLVYNVEHYIDPGARFMSQVRVGPDKAT